jgi:ubiquinone/menaquinone biosynthesis C-methylase UbiE
MRVVVTSPQSENQRMNTGTSTSALTSDDAPSVEEYDRFAWLYDLIVPSQLYHRLVWGMAPGEHGRFAESGLAAAAPGLVLDAGCGSLVFTAQAYSNWVEGSDADPSLTLLDGSRGMLRRARARLAKRSERAAARAQFVQGDLLRLPFADERFTTVFHFGVLHCVEGAESVLAELVRVTAPQGRIFLSSLVLGRARGDAFLRKLQSKGHVAHPRTPSEVIALMEKRGWNVTESTVRGSFLFVEATRA